MEASLALKFEEICSGHAKAPRKPHPRIFSVHSWDWSATAGRQRYLFWNRDPQGREFICDYQTPGWRKVSIQLTFSGITGEVIRRIVRGRNDLNFRDMRRPCTSNAQGREMTITAGPGLTPPVSGAGEERKMPKVYLEEDLIIVAEREEGEDVCLDLSDLQSLVALFRDARDWRRFHTPKNLAQAIAAEAGELNDLYLWERQPELVLVGEEMADILIYLLFLADVTGTNLSRRRSQKTPSKRRKIPGRKSEGR